MSIFDDIQTLEQKLQDELIKAGNYSSVDDFVQAYTDAVLEGLGELSGRQLERADLDAIVQRSLENSRELINTDLAGQIDSSVNQVINDTTSFYQSVGVDLPDVGEAIRRSKDAKQITKLFQEGMSEMREELLDGTIETIQKAIAEGNINRADIADKIFEFTDGKAHYARTNARQFVSTYNRIGRDQVRESAGLTHGYYYGDRRLNTRAFCLRCIDRVFTVEDIERMDNGQLSPVKIYAGGWNCIHSWMWVDPEWDEELEQKITKTRIVESEEDSLDLKVPEE